MQIYDRNVLGRLSTESCFQSTFHTVWVWEVLVSIYKKEKV